MKNCKIYKSSLTIIYSSYIIIEINILKQVFLKFKLSINNFVQFK